MDIEDIVRRYKENDYTNEERLKIITNPADQCEEHIKEYNESCAIVRLMRNDIADSIYELAEDAYWDIREGSVDSARDKLMEIKSLAKDIMNIEL